MRRLLLVLLVPVFVSGCHQNANNEPAAKNEAQAAAKRTEDRGSWKKLKPGMTEEQVRANLGEPLKTQTEGEVICWHYQEGQLFERNATDPKRWMISRGSLLFSAKGSGAPRLTEWKEP